ncbi:unnamed protein product [Acanthoscelides obtectus]|uniref:Uncharacterized protein n=1 Tax=Acanthoscelides obtectus TaxID=200917 RepID=A0A9P0KGV3_ACAOB|nr:unnamed protein product [Acanthoscelides obtectus]CAK1645507.1 hypothetical protein AOBTE_LOCUS14132 [Acanthoscelides obtectus]
MPLLRQSLIVTDLFKGPEKKETLYQTAYSPISAGQSVSIRRFNVTVVAPPTSGADDVTHDMGGPGCPEILSSPASGRHRAGAHGPFATGQSVSIRRFNVTVVAPPTSGADDVTHDMGGPGCPEILSSPASGRHRAGAHGPFASIPEDHALDDPPPLQPPSGGGGQRSRGGSRCASPAPSWDFSLEESSDSVEYFDHWWNLANLTKLDYKSENKKVCRRMKHKLIAALLMKNISLPDLSPIVPGPTASATTFTSENAPLIIPKPRPLT